MLAKTPQQGRDDVTALSNNFSWFRQNTFVFTNQGLSLSFFLAFFHDYTEIFLIVASIP